MLTEAKLWERIHGRAAPPEPARPLRAGAVEALLDGIDLRYVRAGGVEAVRRIYVAVRDHNWNTIPGVITELRSGEAAGGFEVAFTCRHLGGDVDFAWDGSIVGARDGTITYRMDGRAEADFDYNRIGFCILHPYRESIGARYDGRTPDGTVAGTLPDLIEPQSVRNGSYVSLFDAVEELAVELPGGGRVRFTFEGDVFEAEDQRNWTDASLKTYSTPLGLGRSRRAQAGDAIRQVVRIGFDALPAGGGRPAPGVLRLGGPVRSGLAAIGLGAPTHAEPLSARHSALLGALAPDHLRADVRLADPGHVESLVRVLRDCAALGAPLELALYLVEDDVPALAGIRGALGDAPLARVLVYAADAVSPGDRETTPPALVELVRNALERPGVPVGGGTDMYFCELNRTRPDAGALDVVAWSANPQVHAFDERSIMETLAAQAETVRSAMAFAPGVPLAVTPLTLKPRFNANATRAEDTAAEGELPVPVDPRQASLFAAAWTVGSIKRLVEAGAHSLTYFEPVGWRGLIESEAGPPLPDRFPSGPGIVFPVYHVLADLTGRRDDEVVALDAGDDLVVTGLALRGPRSLRVIAANLTAEPLEASVSGLPDGPASVRLLDAGSAQLAGSHPERFRREAAEARVAGGALSLGLGPYAVATIDIFHGGAAA